jgi:hypothetical protein
MTNLTHSIFDITFSEVSINLLKILTFVFIAICINFTNETCSRGGIRSKIFFQAIERLRIYTGYLLGCSLIDILLSVLLSVLIPKISGIPIASCIFGIKCILTECENMLKSASPATKRRIAKSDQDLKVLLQKLHQLIKSYRDLFAPP